MEKEDKFRSLAGILLIISAFTHVFQLFIFGFTEQQIIAAVWGSFYVILGLLLIYLKKNTFIPLLVAIILTYGGIWGFIRFITILKSENIFNYFNLFHVIVDVIVVPICIYLYLKLRKTE